MAAVGHPTQGRVQTLHTAPRLKMAAAEGRVQRRWARRCHLEQEPRPREPRPESPAPESPAPESPAPCP